jgi:hypothetical protein
MIDTIISKDLFLAYGQGIARGKKYRDIILKDNLALVRYTGKYLQPQILHACTDLAISQCLSSIPGVILDEKSNKRNYTFLEIATPDFFMTTSRVTGCATVPRHARFRCVRSMRNQPLLFDDQKDDLPIGKPYLILVHGLTIKKRKGEVVLEELFGGIGMPNADEPTRWNEFISLNDYIDTAAIDTPDETIDERDPGFLKLKKQYSGDNGDGKDSA